MSCLCVLLGGLGRSQLGAIRAAVESIPDVVVYEPEGDDQYKANIEPVLEKWSGEHSGQSPRTNFALITHSLSCEEGSAFRNEYDFLDVYVVELCPVWRRKKRPDAKYVDVFQPTFPFDFPHAEVDGVEPIIVQGAGHNDICARPEVIERIVYRVTELAKG